MQKRQLGWIGIVLALIWSVSSADAAYTLRKSVITSGAITFTGNTLGLNKVVGGNSQGTANSIGTFITTNTALQDIPATGTGPAYPLGTTADWTKNSSFAMLNIPVGATVIYAELIWGGSFNFGGENVSAFLGNSVNFTTPDGVVHSVAPQLSPAVSAVSGTPPNFYVRSADVTSFVTTGGKYIAGKIPATQSNSEDNSNNAGWTLAVIYGKSGLPTRNLSLFVGAELTNSSGSSQATVSGFCTPQSGVRSGRMMVSAMEGDPFGGDGMKFGPTAASLTQISGPNNPVNNFFASQINDDNGALDTSGSFGTVNSNAATATSVVGARQGWDITNVDVSSTLGSSQTTAVAQGSTSSDQYVINALALQINVGSPKFPTTVKTVDKANAAPGDTLSYTIIMDNRTGTADAASVIFKDSVPSGTSFIANSFKVDGITQTGADPTAIAGVNVGTIAGGTLKTITFQVKVNSVPASPAPASYSNQAKWDFDFVSCAGQPITPGDLITDTATTNAPRLEPSKSVSPVGAVLPNSTLTYTITVPNTGLAPTSAATLLESIPAGTSYVSGSTTLNGVSVPDVAGSMPYLSAKTINSSGQTAGVITPGANAVIVFKVTVNQFSTGTITNTASIDQDGAAGIVPAVNASASNTVQLISDLEIVKTASPNPVVIRGNLSYSLTVKNNGPSNVTGATVTDNLSAGLTNATWTCVASGGSSCPASGSGSINAGVDLGVGTANQVVFTITGTVAANAPNPMANTASVAVPATWLDSVAANNTSSASVVVTAPDLTIAKSHTPEPMTRGSSSGVYSISVSNVGTAASLSDPAFNTVTVTDTLPTGLTPTAASGTGWTCGIAGQTLTCSRSNSLSVGSSYPSIQIAVTAAQNVPASLTNTAIVSGGGEVNIANNSATDPTNFVSSSDLSLLKTVSDPTPAIGSTIAYTLSLTNAGPTETTGVTVKDLLSSGLGFVSSSASQGTYDSSTGIWTVGNMGLATVTLTINAQVNASGTIQNLAEVSASSVTDPDSVPGDGVGDDAASVSLTTRVPDLSIAKTHLGNLLEARAEFTL